MKYQGIIRFGNCILSKVIIIQLNAKYELQHMIIF